MKKHGQTLILVCFGATALATAAHGAFDSGKSSTQCGRVQLDAGKQQLCIPGKQQLQTQAKIKHNKIPLSYLDSSNTIDRIAAMISSNEGSPTAIVWNDAGKGVSVGMFQANQKVGQLPKLLHEMANDSSGRSELQQAFGNAVTSKMAADQDVVKTLSFRPNNRLGKGLRRLTKSPEFQKMQVKALRQKISKAAKIARRHGIESSAGVALTADLANQWGDRGADRWLGRHAKADNSELARFQSVVAAVNAASKYGSRYKNDLDKAIANGLSFTEPFSDEQQLASDESSAIPVVERSFSSTLQ